MSKVNSKELPKKIKRVSDGQILILNDNDTYSFEESQMAKPHQYTYEVLMITYKGQFVEVL